LLGTGAQSSKEPSMVMLCGKAARQRELKQPHTRRVARTMSDVATAIKPYS